MTVNELLMYLSGHNLNDIVHIRFSENPKIDCGVLGRLHSGNELTIWFGEYKTGRCPEEEQQYVKNNKRFEYNDYLL